MIIWLRHRPLRMIRSRLGRGSIRARGRAMLQIKRIEALGSRIIIPIDYLGIIDDESYFLTIGKETDS